MRPLQILALGHNASRTGAPILLREFIAWIAKNEDRHVRCVLGRGGALRSDYQSLCDCYIADDYVHWSIKQRVAKKLGLGKPPEAALERWLGTSSKPDVIYVNTIAAIPLLRRVQKVYGDSIPSVIHVHELTWLLRLYEQQDQISEVLRSAAKVVAVSQAVRRALQRECGVSADKIELVYEYLCHQVCEPQAREQNRHAIRAELGVAEGDLLCLSMGTQEWRKAPELLPMIAQECKRRGSRAKFIWLGGETRDRSVCQLQLDADRLGVADVVQYMGELPDTTPYLSAADLFLLTSREDPYPLAMLEAASFGLPVICFEDSGGAPEFVAEGAGVAVPYLDIHAMADTVIQIDQDRDALRRMGQAGRDKVACHHGLDDAAYRIFQILTESIERPALAVGSVE